MHRPVNTYTTNPESLMSTTCWARKPTNDSHVATKEGDPTMASHAPPNNTPPGREIARRARDYHLGTRHGAARPMNCEDLPKYATKRGAEHPRGTSQTSHPAARHNVSKAEKQNPFTNRHVETMLITAVFDRLARAHVYAVPRRYCPRGSCIYTQR